MCLRKECVEADKPKAHTKPRLWEREFYNLYASLTKKGEALVNGYDDWEYWSIFDTLKVFVSTELECADREARRQMCASLFGRKADLEKKWYHEECKSGKKEMCENCHAVMVYNKALNEITEFFSRPDNGDF